MKKLFLGVGLFLCCSCTASAIRIVTVQCGGGPGGYKSVWEQHVADYHALNCEDGGSAACKWKTPPPQRVSVTPEEALYTVEAKIAEGVLEGQIAYADCVLSWSAQSPACFTYSVED